MAGTAAGLLAAGFVARIREDYEAAGCLLDEALALARATDHAFVTAAVLHHLGMIGTDVRQDHAAARGLLQESLALYQKLGLPRFMALVSLTLGEVARAEGNPDGARELLQSLMLMRNVGERLGVPGTLDAVAHLAMTTGHHNQPPA